MTCCNICVFLYLHIGITWPLWFSHQPSGLVDCRERKGTFFCNCQWTERQIVWFNTEETTRQSTCLKDRRTEETRRESVPLQPLQGFLEPPQGLRVFSMTCRSPSVTKKSSSRTHRFSSGIPGTPSRIHRVSSRTLITHNRATIVLKESPRGPKKPLKDH